MTVTTNDKVRLMQANTDHIAAYLAMYNMLGEGDFGMVFRHFHSDHPEMGRFVVEHALATYEANQHKWVGMGQFTANYHTLVIKYSQAQFTQKWTYQDKWLVWEMYAEMMREFATGE